MTIVASIHPSGELPFFLVDTLLSMRGRQEGHIFGPGGLMLPPDADDGYRAAKLEQKSAILQNTTLVAYAGRRDIALPVFRKVAQAVAKRRPSRDLIRSVLDGHTKSLENNDTSVLIAFIQDSGAEVLEFGHEFESAAVSDGTECRAVGSGTEALFDLLPTIMSAEGRSDTPIPDYHMRIMKLLAHMAEAHTAECITGKFHDHFGGIMEMIRATPTGFEKFPGATFATELLRLAEGEAILLGGSYMTYQYSGDVLVFRRFGQIRTTS